MKNNLKNLLKLIKENPELPVIPFVDGEIVCGDEYCRWIGSIGDVNIKEFCTFKERYYFKDEIEDLIDSLTCAYDYNIEQAEEDAKRMNWQKAICVNIDLPEV